ncbi:hypothetical protein K488DRAFT_55720 [Vararia minispora EC-137]|uniref:Uncharacterized protein n=1 Tax=Vararia minispora EC-137 TaxID=1314806 RepID=A0ACB8QDR1_9AGAM|nr:hypothetical protein K488DRAFT_55720 [Vararia minispora EC-137]
MPRRPPPSALLLKDGPLPARGTPKFTLPSMPRPAVCAPAPAPRGGPPRSVQHPTRQTGAGAGEKESGVRGRNGMRAPWNHAESIAKSLDTGSVIAPPEQAASGAVRGMM